MDGCWVGTANLGAPHWRFGDPAHICNLSVAWRGGGSGTWGLSHLVGWVRDAVFGVLPLPEWPAPAAPTQVRITIFCLAPATLACAVLQCSVGDGAPRCGSISGPAMARHSTALARGPSRWVAVAR